MRKIYLILGLLLLSGAALSDVIEQNDYVYFTCNNATSGVLLCSAASLDCYNSTDVKTVDTDAATEIVTGQFKFQFTNLTDGYACFVDCCTGAVDYSFPVWVRTTPLIDSDNIGIDLDDIIGTLDDSEIGFLYGDNATLTALKSTVDTNLDEAISGIDDNPWDDGTRQLTSPVCTDDNQNMTGVSGAAAQASDIWQYGNRNLTTALTEEGTNMSAIADVDGLLNVSQFDLNISSLPKSIWDFVNRTLTFYPPTTAVLSIDISQSGILNTTYYNGEVVHILGDIEPENSESMKDNYYLKSIFYLGSLPTNMTNAWLTFWAKKTGTPTGQINISIDGNLINTTDVASFSTSHTKYVIQFGAANITSAYIEILFNGTTDWTGASYPFIASDQTSGVNSYASSDAGATWAHTINELAVGLTIEYNQVAIADQLNKEVHTILEEDVFAGCPGEMVIARFSGRNFKGENLIADSVTSTCAIELFNGTDVKKTELDSPTFSTNLSSNGREYYVVWNNTEGTELGINYEFECEINWTKEGTTYSFDADSTFLFARECWLNNSILSEIYEVDTQLENIGVVVNETNGTLISVNQSLTDKIIGTAEGLANLTAAEVWAYATRILTSPVTSGGENMSSVADISTLLTTARFDLNVSQVLTAITTAQTNVQTSIYGLANTSATQVWAFATRALSTPIATDNSQNMTGITDIADLEGILNVSQFDKNMSDVRGDISTTQSNILTAIYGLANTTKTEIWAAGTRTLTGFNILVNLTASTIDDVWDETITDHLATNSTGDFLYETLKFVDDTSSGGLNTIYLYLVDEGNFANDTELDSAETNILAGQKEINNSIIIRGDSAWITAKVGAVNISNAGMRDIGFFVWNHTLQSFITEYNVTNYTVSRRANETILEIHDATNYFQPGGF